MASLNVISMARFDKSYIKTRYKFCKFCKTCARDTPLQGVYISHFGQILVKISVLGVLYTLIFAPMGVKFGTEEGTAPSCQISPPTV